MSVGRIGQQPLPSMRQEAAFLESLWNEIDIEAQEYAKGFYEQVGFHQSSEPFMLDGIPHIKMTYKG